MEDLPEKEIATHSSGSLPGEFHGQRSLAGYNPWGHKESDMTEHMAHPEVELLNRVVILASTF